jgi:very-short-patch-repair endonuclease
VHRVELDHRDWCWRDDLKVTTAARTVVDLARRGFSDHGPDALRKRRVTPARLAHTLERNRGRPGQVAARAVVMALAGNPWSVAEGRAHELLRRAGITGWVANVAVVVNGRTVIPDIAFEELKLAIEIDGREHHDNTAAFESDRERQNLLVAAGWTVLRFTWRQLRDQPDLVIAMVKTTVARLRVR